MASTTFIRRDLPGPASPDQTRHEAILAQVERMAASPLFRHSKHYPAFLRYVVEQSLKGRGSQLKERVLGFEVFGRDPNYDTNSDPVVRNTACEVRKRITQYYLEPGHEAEIRIELPAGSYVPEFLSDVPAAPAFAPSVVQTIAADKAPPERASIFQRRTTGLWAGGVVLAAAVAAAAFLYQPADALDQFWAPIWSSTDSIMLGISGGASPQPAAGAAPSALDVARSDRIAFADGLTIARLTGLLGQNHKKFDIRRSTTFTLADLRKEPAVLVGGFNNQWSMRLEDKFRFTLDRDPETHLLYVGDRRNPSARNWTGNPDLPYSQLTEDYAIVSRFLDERTERMVLVVAGMGKDGTIAAGEFVTTPRYLEMLRRQAPSGWEKKNLQVVLATEIVNGNPGPPRILAAQFW
jgi:hypothetical protein